MLVGLVQDLSINKIKPINKIYIFLNPYGKNNRKNTSRTSAAGKVDGTNALCN